MAEQSFRRVLRQTIAAFGALAAAAAAFAFLFSYQIDRAAEGSKNAHEVLVAHVTLSQDALAHFKQMADAALMDEILDAKTEAEGVARLDAGIVSIRALIGKEVAYGLSSDNEASELARLDAIEAALDRGIADYGALKAQWRSISAGDRRERIGVILDDRIDRQFQSMIVEAIDEERSEVALADRHLRSVARRFRYTASVLLAFAAIVIAVSFHRLNRALALPLQALADGADAYARGELDRPIKPTMTREFEVIRSRLTQMASDLAAHRVSIETANERLESEVADRTKELAAANHRLATADASRRAFFADVSHELRTPLTVIRGEAEIALRGPDRASTDYKESLARIVQYAGETTWLVDDLLFIARADAGEPALDMAEFSLAELLKETVKSFEPIAAAREVRLNADIDYDEVAMYGDRRRMRQVFGIVLDNAIRYSRAGGEVRTHLLQKEGKLSVAVEDDGIGLSDDDRGRVFDRFYRAENARDHVSGSGLGLPVAKAIVEAHHGEIRLLPSATGGVRAEIFLPAEVKLRAQ